MKKYSLILIIIFISCNEKPTYNPFDNKFNGSVRSLILDNCERVSAGCGYINITKREGKLKPFYQIFLDDFNNVLAKGFIYEIDTFKTTNFDDFKIDSLEKLPINEEELNAELKRFKYKINSRFENEILLVNDEGIDTVLIKINAFTINKKRHIKRKIEFYKARIEDTNR